MTRAQICSVRRQNCFDCVFFFPLMPTDAKDLFMIVSFCFLRFLGNEVFNFSGLTVSLGSEIVPQVKFFKIHFAECQSSELLCKLTMHENFVSRSYYFVT